MGANRSLARPVRGGLESFEWMPRKHTV